MHSIAVTTDGPVSILTLNRPERLNAVTPAMIGEINIALTEVAADSACNALILAGSGRGFCAGLDLDVGFGACDEATRVEHNREFMANAVCMTRTLRSMRQPVIAALHGPVVGVGLALACAADIRIADTTTKFGAGFVALGMSPGDIGLSWFLPRIIGPSSAAEMLLTARTIDVAEAESLGLATKVDEGKALDRAAVIAATIAGHPRFAVTATKELLNASVNGVGYAEHLALEQQIQTLCSLTEPFEQARLRFMNRKRHSIETAEPAQP